MEPRTYARRRIAARGACGSPWRRVGVVAALALALQLVAPAPWARADERCEAAWVARAAADTGVAMELAGCPDGLFKLRLRPADAPPLEVEIASSPGPAFRRAGPLRVSPIVSAVYAELPAGQRRDFERLLTWLEGHYEEIGLARGLSFRALEPDAAGPDSGVAIARAPFSMRWLWFGPLGLALLLAARARARVEDARSRSRARWAPLSLFALAFAARWLLGIWGPLHANGQGPAWMQLVSGGAGVDLGRYGPGYPELMLPLTRWLGAGLQLAPDVSLLLLNVTLSSAAVVLVYALARGAGLGREGALLAGGLMAADPVQVRVAATEGYFAVIIALTLAASLGVQRASGALARGGRGLLEATLWLAGAALLAAQAARVHPIAWIPVALIPLLAAAIDGLCPPGQEVSRARRLAHVALAGLVLAGVALLTSAPELEIVRARALGEYGGGGGSSRFLRPQDPLRSLAVWAWALALLVALARGGARARALLLTIGLVHLGSAIATRTSYGQSPQWRASYDRLFAPALALGLASLWPRRREDELARAAEGDPPANDMSKETSKAPAGAALVITGDAPARARVWLVVAGSSALLTALHGRATLGSTTEQLEHHAVRRALAAFPEPCALAYVNAVGDGRVLTLPDLGLVGAGAHLVVTAPDGELPTPVPTIGGCLLYAHVSLCASAEGRPACTRVEQQLPLGEPLMMTTLPARQSHVSFPYDQDVVDVALYRVALEGAGSR